MGWNLKTRPWHRRIAVVLGALIMAVTVGCEREEFDPEATAEGASVETTSGSHQYLTRVDEADLEVGQPQTVTIQVFPKEDLKINLEFPWSIEFLDNDELELDQVEWDQESIEMSEEQAEIPLTVTAASAADHRLEARANFSVCNDDRCYIFSDESLEFVVHAQD